MAKLRHGEGSVSRYALADGTERWRARWYDRGRVRSRSFATESDANDHLIQVATNVRLGRHIPTSMLTIEEACNRYIKRNAERWTTNTLASYRQVARSHVYPHIGKVRVGDLTTSRVQDWIDLLVRKKLAASTVSNANLIVRGTFADLVRMDEVQRNPCIGVRLPSRKKPKRIIWNEDQMAAAIKHAADISLQTEVLYRVALTTGIRPGELRALMWKDIDFKRGTIRVERSVTRDERFRTILGSDTKTHQARTVAAPVSTMHALKLYRAEQVERRLSSPRWNDTDLVFDRGNGHLVAQQSIQNRHVRVCKAAGIPQCRMHDLRHACATALLRNGVSAKVVADLLGHANIAVTLDIYSHTDIGMQRAATDILGEIAK